MNTNALGRALRAIYGADDPLDGHSQRTIHCPSLARLGLALEEEGWTSEEQAHVACCAYCQKMAALHRRLQQPGNPQDPRSGSTSRPG